MVDDKKHYIGGMIMPGVQISLDALTSRASQLSGISIEEPKKIIGKNTVDCMKSGILYGNAAALDGFIDRIEEELGQKVTVIATGGMSDKGSLSSLISTKKQLLFCQSPKFLFQKNNCFYF